METEACNSSDTDGELIESDREFESDNNDRGKATGAKLSGSEEIKEIVCIDGKKLSCPIESCDSVSNESNLRLSKHSITFG